MRVDRKDAELSQRPQRILCELRAGLRASAVKNGMK